MRPNPARDQLRRRYAAPRTPNFYTHTHTLASVPMPPGNKLSHPKLAPSPNQETTCRPTERVQLAHW